MKMCTSRRNYTLNNWIDEWNKHPTWKEMSTDEINKDKSGVRGLYRSLSRWIKKETKDPYEIRIIKQMILGRELQGDKSGYTFDEWVKEWNGCPEWKKMNTCEMNNDKNGASGLYCSLSAWIAKETRDPYERRILKQMILGRKLQGDKTEYTFDEWVNEWNKHPTWKEMSTDEINKDKSGVRGLYRSLSKWIRKETNDPYEHRIIKQMIFGRKFGLSGSNDRLNLTGILEDLLEDEK